MSWQAYVDQSLVGSGHVDKAAIFGSDGTSAWAASPGFQLKPAEMSEVVKSFQDKSEPKSVMSNGFHIAGKKYMTLKADDRSLYGKQGKEGSVIVKTKQAILVAHYPDGVQPGNCVTTVEKLADYLIGMGY